MVTGSRHECSELTTRARRTIAVLVKEGKCLLELLDLGVCELLCAVRHCKITTSWEQDRAGSRYTGEANEAGAETSERLDARTARAHCLSRFTLTIGSDEQLGTRLTPFAAGSCHGAEFAVRMPPDAEVAQALVQLTAGTREYFERSSVLTSSGRSCSELRRFERAPCWAERPLPPARVPVALPLARKCAEYDVMCW